MDNMSAVFILSESFSLNSFSKLNTFKSHSSIACGILFGSVCTFGLITSIMRAKA